MLVNYHLHDERSSDGEGTLADHCAVAARAGLAEICVTNHVEVLDAGEWTVDAREAEARFAAVLASVEEARASFPGLAVRFGAEFAYRPEWTEALEQLRSALPFDFVIGSLHAVDGHDISGGDGPAAFFATRSRAEAYGAYFRGVEEMVRWGRFHVVGHLDLVKRYGHRAHGPYRPEEFREPIRRILRGMAERGIGVEVNTSGLFQAPRAPYPEAEILVWARDLGVPFLTLGADSHRPADVARGLSEGLALARRCGWGELTTCREGRARPVRIR